LKNWIANKVETVGAREEFIMLSSVNWMFEAVSQNLFAGRARLSEEFADSCSCSFYKRLIAVWVGMTVVVLP